MRETWALSLVGKVPWGRKRLPTPVSTFVGFPGGSAGQESARNVGDGGSIPGSGRSGEGNGNPPQYSCLENFMATVHGIAKSLT